jgi:DsbC/DsbD-like thiol-disulfide interchange protein
MNSPHEDSHIQDHVVSISSGGNASITHHRQKATDAANEILKAGPSVSGSGTTTNLVGGKNKITVAMSEKGNESRLVKGKK